MRIAQIIDSLEIGGAERMAINYANALSEKIEFSGLIVTRKEGDLKSQISKRVSYFYLERKKTIDFWATLRLKKYCKENKVTIVHAHSTSYFTAVLLKIALPKIKIIWHDHYGMSEYLNERKSKVLKASSFLFLGIISVNNQLKNWAEKELYSKNVIYFPNFTCEVTSIISETLLEGISGKRILCLANLRQQKNHFLLLEVAVALKSKYSDWTFHLVGKDFEDDYSKEIHDLIDVKNLKNNVFVYGSKNDIENIIEQSEICVLTSNSEGLPVALLEYGFFSKPVVTTNVGEIPEIIKNGFNGFIVPINDVILFSQSIIKLINDENLRTQLGNALNETVIKNNSKKAVINNYLNWIETK